MSYRELRRQAILLRQQGNTYSQIIKDLRVPKSTLSEWLNGYPLSNNQIQLLEQSRKNSRMVAIEKTREAKYKKRQARVQAVFKERNSNFTKLTQREIGLGGLFLYWGEGNKSSPSVVSISNTDPYIVHFALYWLIKGLRVPKSTIAVFLQLYSDMDSNQEISFWSKLLTIPRSQFRKTYIKTSNRSDVDHKGFRHGTCNLTVYNTRLKEQVLADIKVISNFYTSIRIV